jgi:cold-inducible RNA-binding protein
MADRCTGRSRGSAFVEMTNASEGEKAIAELNGGELVGRTINVNEGRPKAERFGGNRGRERTGSPRGRGRW